MSRPKKSNLIKRLEEEKLNLEANEYVTRHGYVRKVATKTVRQWDEERTLRLEYVEKEFYNGDADWSDVFAILEKYYF